MGKFPASIFNVLISKSLIKPKEGVFISDAFLLSWHACTNGSYMPKPLEVLQNGEYSQEEARAGENEKGNPGNQEAILDGRMMRWGVRRGGG